MGYGRPMIGAFFRRMAACLVAATLTLGTASCLDESRFQVGWATFFVEFYDPVVDRFGVPQLAYCARNLTFTGQIDTACVQLPMVYSFGMSALVSCTYLDAAGIPWTYTDLFYFWPGYIQEPACFEGFEAPTDEPDMDLTRDSMLSRDEQGQVTIEDDRIMLSTEQASLGDLRAFQSAETGEVAPTGLSDDALLVEPLRTSETIRGEPPEGVNDLPED